MLSVGLFSKGGRVVIGVCERRVCVIIAVIVYLYNTVFS